MFSTNPATSASATPAAPNTDLTFLYEDLCEALGKLNETSPISAATPAATAPVLHANLDAKKLPLLDGNANKLLSELPYINACIEAFNSAILNKQNECRQQIQEIGQPLLPLLAKQARNEAYSNEDQKLAAQLQLKLKSLQDAYAEAQRYEKLGQQARAAFTEKFLSLDESARAAICEHVAAQQQLTAQPATQAAASSAPTAASAPAGSSIRDVTSLFTSLTLLTQEEVASPAAPSKRTCP